MEIQRNVGGEYGASLAGIPLFGNDDERGGTFCMNEKTPLNRYVIYFSHHLYCINFDDLFGG